MAAMKKADSVSSHWHFPHPLSLLDLAAAAVPLVQDRRRHFPVSAVARLRLGLDLEARPPARESTIFMWPAAAAQALLQMSSDHVSPLLNCRNSFL